jgi:hypothetical protein
MGRHSSAVRPVPTHLIIQCRTGIHVRLRQWFGDLVGSLDDVGLEVMTDKEACQKQGEGVRGEEKKKDAPHIRLLSHIG